MTLDITNTVDFKTGTIFGDQLEFLFGVTANQFYNYIYRIKKLTYQSDEWRCLFKNLVNFCLLGRWFYFKFKLQSDITTQSSSLTFESNLILNSIRLPSTEELNFKPIYDYINDVARGKLASILNESSSSSEDESEDTKSFIIDETVLLNENEALNDTVVDDPQSNEKNKKLKV
jgi:hypothetical protein